MTRIITFHVATLIFAIWGSASALYDESGVLMSSIPSSCLVMIWCRVHHACSHVCVIGFVCAAFEVKVQILYPISGSVLEANAAIRIVILSQDFERDRDDNRIFLCIDGASVRSIEAGLVMEVISFPSFISTPSPIFCLPPPPLSLLRSLFAKVCFVLCWCRGSQ